MDDEIFNKGLLFAKDNNFTPVIFDDPKSKDSNFINIISNKSKSIYENSIVICDNNSDLPSDFNGACILLITKNNIRQLSKFIIELNQKANRINLIIKDIEEWNDIDVQLYKDQLEILMEYIYISYKNNVKCELNVLTDIFELNSMCNCDAGKNHISLAPNGKFYICPAFYFDNPNNSIGNLEEGINISNEHLLDINNAPICLGCDSYHCRRCVYLNKKLTNEINTPSKIQCIVSHIERSVSLKLQQMLKKENIIPRNILKEIDYLDPIEKLQEGEVN